MDSTVLGSHLSCIYISNKMVVLHWYSITKYIANIPKMNQLSYYNIILPLNSYESLLPTSNRSWHPGLIAMSDSLDHPITRGLSSINISSTKTSKEQHVCTVVVTVVHKKTSYILKGSQKKQLTKEILWYACWKKKQPINTSKYEVLF